MRDTAELAAKVDADVVLGFSIGASIASELVASGPFSVGVVKRKGASEDVLEGPTKTGRSRVVDLDAVTVAALRSYRAARGGLALGLVRDSALVLSNLDGANRHPERFSRRFTSHVHRARKALGAERLPLIRLHDLRHRRHAASGRRGAATARPRRAGE